MLTEIQQSSAGSIDSRNIAADHGLLRMVTYQRHNSLFLGLINVISLSRMHVVVD